ncbi:uncharacterized protein DUF2474 [Hephaestia caeni]|jgi:hypothetical protein|uniref:Uncharacterized protein DUF2474 n=2 Tax=Sphingomonadaceae TaxID=41297 RepID=A0A397NR81_9SPHN|nr:MULTISPECIES: DUF2474 domain-containing protein [Sphingomonadaceae]QTH22480.1 DUF2474 domain-containing protein [Rhizorhabdus wittichii]RIA37275.1 uncharacterized protein DUF2474 [Hephaestia caeni]
MSSDRRDKKLWPRRIGWLVLIWVASVGVLAIVAVLFRLLMNMAGLTV